MDLGEVATQCADRAFNDLFAGLFFVVHLEGPLKRGYPPEKTSYTAILRKLVLAAIVRSGGTVVGTEDELVDGTTHVIATHAEQKVVQQAAAARARGVAVRVFGPQWVLSAVDAGELLEDEASSQGHGTYGVLAGPYEPGVPGIRDYTAYIRVSATPMDKSFRTLLYYWVEAMGGLSADRVPAEQTSHILTWNWGTMTESQAECAAAYPHLRIVNYHWLLRCRDLWSVVEDEPFLLRPAGEGGEPADGGGLGDRRADGEGLPGGEHASSGELTETQLGAEEPVAGERTRVRDDAHDQAQAGAPSQRPEPAPRMQTQGPCSEGQAEEAHRPGCGRDLAQDEGPAGEQAREADAEPVLPQPGRAQGPGHVKPEPPSPLGAGLVGPQPGCVPAAPQPAPLPGTTDPAATRLAATAGADAAARPGCSANVHALEPLAGLPSGSPSGSRSGSPPPEPQQPPDVLPDRGSPHGLSPSREMALGAPGARAEPSPELEPEPGPGPGAGPGPEPEPGPGTLEAAAGAEGDVAGAGAGGRGLLAVKREPGLGEELVEAGDGGGGATAEDSSPPPLASPPPRRSPPPMASPAHGHAHGPSPSPPPLPSPGPPPSPSPSRLPSLSLPQRSPLAPLPPGQLNVPAGASAPAAPGDPDPHQLQQQRQRLETPQEDQQRPVKPEPRSSGRAPGPALRQASAAEACTAASAGVRAGPDEGEGERGAVVGASLAAADAGADAVGAGGPAASQSAALGVGSAASHDAGPADYQRARSALGRSALLGSAGSEDSEAAGHARLALLSPPPLLPPQHSPAAPPAPALGPSYEGAADEAAGPGPGPVVGPSVASAPSVAATGKGPGHGAGVQLSALVAEVAGGKVGARGRGKGGKAAAAVPPPRCPAPLKKGLTAAAAAAAAVAAAEAAAAEEMLPPAEPADTAAAAAEDMHTATDRRAPGEAAVDEGEEGQSKRRGGSGRAKRAGPVTEAGANEVRPNQRARRPGAVADPVAAGDTSDGGMDVDAGPVVMPGRGASTERAGGGRGKAKARGKGRSAEAVPSGQEASPLAYARAGEAGPDEAAAEPVLEATADEGNAAGPQPIHGRRKRAKPLESGVGGCSEAAAEAEGGAGGSETEAEAGAERDGGTAEEPAAGAVRGQRSESAAGAEGGDAAAVAEQPAKQRRRGGGGASGGGPATTAPAAVAATSASPSHQSADGGDVNGASPSDGAATTAVAAGPPADAEAGGVAWKPAKRRRAAAAAAAIGGTATAASEPAEAEAPPPGAAGPAAEERQDLPLPSPPPQPQPQGKGRGKRRAAPAEAEAEAAADESTMAAAASAEEPAAAQPEGRHAPQAKGKGKRGGAAAQPEPNPDTVEATAGSEAEAAREPAQPQPTAKGKRKGKGGPGDQGLEAAQAPAAAAEADAAATNDDPSPASSPPALVPTQAPAAAATKRRRGAAPAAAATAGGAATGGDGAGGEAAAAGERRLVFGLSGFADDERTRFGATLKNLGLPYIAVNEKWDMNINALLGPSLKRSDKTICAMASGAWLLHTDYITACQDLVPAAGGGKGGKGKAAALAGPLPDPAPFDLSECADGPGMISTGSPAHWRLRCAARSGPGGSGGAFAGLRLLLPATLPPGGVDSGKLSRMVEAGGGKAVVAKAAQAMEFAQGCHAGVVPRGTASEAKFVAALAAANAAVVAPAYVVEWVAHPWSPLGHHFLYGTSAGPALAALESGRGVVKG